MYVYLQKYIQKDTVKLIYRSKRSFTSTTTL